MKKPRIFAILLCFLMIFSFSGCSSGEGEQPKAMKIDLRSNANENLNVGDSYKIVYRVAGSDQGVNFASSKPEIASVDEYGNVKALDVGVTVITLSLKEDETVTETVTVTVSKTFFIDKNGFKRDGVDFSNEEAGEISLISGQAHALVSEYSQKWYFSCHLDYVAPAGGEFGRWGIGSFLVNDSMPIGETMAWFGFKPQKGGKHTPYVGGWRAVTSNQDPETDISTSDMDLTNGADVELIRDGIKHYYTVTAGDTTIKYVYDVPKFANKPTYPGVYAQEQNILVTNFAASSKSEVVNQKLSDYQRAESVALNFTGDALNQGEIYLLTSTVLPEETYDKSVVYSLKTAVEGISLSDNVLSVGAAATGSLTIVATAVSAPNVASERTFEIIPKPISESTLFDTGMIIGKDNVVLSDTGMNISGDAYVPLTARGEKWYASFKVSGTAENATEAKNTKIGIMSATAGYTQYFKTALVYSNTNSRTMEFGELGGKTNKTAYAADKIGTYSTQNAVGLIRDGDTYYIIVNDRIIRSYKADAFASSPVFFSEGAKALISNITVTTNADEVDAVLDSYEFYVGGYVTKTDNTYVLAEKDFGSSPNDINWPPVNDYENGIKLAKTLTGDYDIEFKMSNIKPMTLGNGEYDSKVLIYLRSETVTSSLQFVIKGNSTVPIINFCPNLNDATWTEYKLWDEIDLLNKEMNVKVIKTANKVEISLNGIKLMSDHNALQNNGFWTSEMPCTPGIGAFRCGVTVKDIVITEK